MCVLNVHGTGVPGDGGAGSCKKSGWDHSGDGEGVLYVSTTLADRDSLQMNFMCYY